MKKKRIHPWYAYLSCTLFLSLLEPYRRAERAWRISLLRDAMCFCGRDVRAWATRTAHPAHPHTHASESRALRTYRTRRVVYVSTATYVLSVGSRGSRGIVREYDTPVPRTYGRGRIGNLMKQKFLRPRASYYVTMILLLLLCYFVWVFGVSRAAVSPPSPAASHQRSKHFTVVYGRAYTHTRSRARVHACWRRTAP